MVFQAACQAQTQVQNRTLGPYPTPIAVYPDPRYRPLLLPRTLPGWARPPQNHPATSARDGVAVKSLERAVKTILSGTLNAAMETRLRLALLACGLTSEAVYTLCGYGTSREQALTTLFFGGAMSSKLRGELSDGFELLQIANHTALLQTPSGSFLTVIGWGLLDTTDYPRDRHKYLSLLAMLNHQLLNGPLPYLTIYCSVFSSVFGLSYWARGGVRDRALNLARAWQLDLDRGQGISRDRALWRKIDVAIANAPLSPEHDDLHSRLWGELDILEAVTGHFAAIFDLQPSLFWLEALKLSRLRDMPEVQSLVDPKAWRKTLEAFSSGRADEPEVWRAASLLFLDGALYMLGFHQP